MTDTPMTTIPNYLCMALFNAEALARYCDSLNARSFLVIARCGRKWLAAWEGRNETPYGAERRLRP